MSEKHTRGEMHGCIVCGALYQLYVVSDEHGKFVDLKVMSPGGKKVPHKYRPPVACEKHTDDEVKSAVQRAYGSLDEDED